MHIGCGQRHIAEGRCLEGASITLQVSLAEAAEIVELTLAIHSFPRVVKAAVGEKRIVRMDGVTGSAIASFGIYKNSETTNRSRRERFFVPAIFISIEWRVAAEECSLE